MWRHRAVMVSFVGGVLLAAWLLPSFVTPLYRAEARLALRIPSPWPRFDPDPGVLRPGTPLAPRQRAWILFQEQERLRGEPLRAELGQELGPAASLLASLQVEPSDPADDSVVRLSLESEDPALAARALARFLEVAAVSSPTVLPGLDPVEEVAQALASAREALARVEGSLRDLEAEESLALLLERTASSRRDRQARKDSLARAEAELQARRASHEALGRQLAGVPEMVLVADTRDLAAPPPDLPILEERIRKLRAEEAELLARYLPDADPVQDVRRRLLAAEASLERLLTPARTHMVLNPLRERLEERLLLDRAEIPALDARVHEGTRRLEDVEAELAGRERRLADLQPQVETLQEERRARIQEVGRLERLLPSLDKTTPGGRVLHEILEPPRKPLFPFHPDRRRVLLLGLLLALVGAPGLAILMDMVAVHGGRAPREVGA